MFTGTDGSSGSAGLVQASDGTFYGNEFQGGTSTACTGGCGTLFSLSVGFPPIVVTVPTFGKVGGLVRILGTNLTGATSVTFNGTAAPFKVISPTEIETEVPAGATGGFVTVTTSTETLKSTVKFRVR
jgi:uncharacterized protein (TIGR03437 family)